MSEIKSTIMRFLPKSLKRKYLENSIQDVENRIEFAKKSVIYYGKRLEELKYDLERL